MELILYPLLAVGAFFCALNIYLSYVRYLIHRLKGGSRDDYKWVSGAPLVGSLFALAGLPAVWHIPWLRAVVIVLILFDTGGIHWFAGTMVWRRLFCRGRAG